MSRLPRVYIYLCPARHVYQDELVNVAEGLRELGVPTYANDTRWKREPGSDDYLFVHDPQVRHEDCDIVLMGATSAHYVDTETFLPEEAPMPEGLFPAGRKWTAVLIDAMDGYNTFSWEPHMQGFDVVLRAKYNRRCHWPANYRPWVLGFSERVLRATQSRLPLDERAWRLLVNFSFTHHFEHGARRLAEEKVIPVLDGVIPVDRTKSDPANPFENDYDRLMDEQTQGKHKADYYRLLGSAAACACHCGEIIAGLPRDPRPILRPGGRGKLLSRLAWGAHHLLGKAPRSIQWDSWRFWEVLCAETCAVNLDLEHYGVLLPEMPENGRHYIGVRYDRARESAEFIREEPARVREIARAGRQWALQHYHPREMARRFLAEAGWDVPAPAPATNP